MHIENIWHKIHRCGREYGVPDVNLRQWKLNGLPRRWQMDVWIKSRELRLGLTPKLIESVSIKRKK